MSDIIIGIDLGTTNSEVAIVQNGQPRVIAVDGDPILPSMVGVSDDGKLLVGKAARNQYILAPDRTVKSIKRKMGQDVKVSLGEQQYRPQEISAMILRRLKDAAEKELGEPVTKAVITVPAYFNDNQRQATREAGELAGLQVVRILNEPTAAALTYSPDPAQHERFLVYDLGGGTFDVSILQAEGGVFEVLASNGDTQLGGDDFDDLLLDYVAADFQKMYNMDLRADRVSKARLLRAVETAKKHLSDHPYARIEEEFIAEKDGVPLHLNLELSREEFETLIAPLVQRTMECMQRAFDDARITAAEIKQVVLVGGSTRSPMISRMLEQRLGQPAHREVHPDLCVALGAAVQAAIVAGQNVGTVLVDITPHSLGIKCLEIPDSYLMHVHEFKFHPIITRNTPLPATRSEAFCTVIPNQPSVEIDIYQGESNDVRRNHRIGRFLIEGLARVPAGNQILVELKLTLDGTLLVSAREKATGLVKQVTIESAMARYALEERDAAQARLNKLWAEPQWDEESQLGPDEGAPSSDTDVYADYPLDEDSDDDADEVEPSETVPTAGPRFQTSPPPQPPVKPQSDSDGHRESVQARALLEKAERVREKATAEDQAELDRLTGNIRTALEARRWPALTTACNTLADVLFYLEDA